jgi:hypothetical protein
VQASRIAGAPDRLLASIVRAAVVSHLATPPRARVFGAPRLDTFRTFAGQLEL